MGRGLLGRLGSSERGLAPAPLDLRDSIAAHLRVLLNTSQGDSPAAPGFGVVDFTDVVHNLPSAVPTLQASIRNVILQFEPRLRNVSVRHIPEPDSLELHFEVTAQLAEKGARGVLKFQTKLAAGGRFHVDD